MPASKIQPALVGGLLIGVLSALPLINIGNCCCLWVTSGGVVAAYLLQQNQPDPIAPGDGAVVGLLAGIVGAFIWALGWLPVNLVTGPLQARMLERIMEAGRDIPEPMRAAVDGMRSGAVTALQLVIGFCFMLAIGMIFSTLGGLVGAVLVKKQSPPATGIRPSM